jgi:hypothetical protein
MISSPEKYYTATSNTGIQSANLNYSLNRDKIRSRVLKGFHKAGKGGPGKLIDHTSRGGDSEKRNEQRKFGKHEPHHSMKSKPPKVKPRTTLVPVRPLPAPKELSFKAKLLQNVCDALYQLRCHTNFIAATADLEYYTRLMEEEICEEA